MRDKTFGIHARASKLQAQRADLLAADLANVDAANSDARIVGLGHGPGSSRKKVAESMKMGLERDARMSDARR